MKMPVLLPVPIETKGRAVLIRIWKWITSIRNWKLYENWDYQLPDKTRIIIPQGFQFDGASIPRPLWAILSPVGLLLIQGLVHDFGYRYDYLWAVNEDGELYKYKEKAGRLYWDRVFREVGVAVNGMAVIDAAAWLMLILFGFGPWRKNRKRNAEEMKPEIDPLRYLIQKPGSEDDTAPPLDSGT